MGALIFSVLPMLLCISINLPYGHAWNTGVYLELLDNLQKQMCRTVGPSLAVFREPLAHHLNVASLSLLYRYYFGRWDVHLSRLNWFHFLIFKGGQLVFLIDCMIFLSPFLDVIYVNSLFPHTATLWNSLPIECFPLTCDLIGYKSRINRQLVSVGSSWTDFLYALIFLWFFFL